MSDETKETSQESRFVSPRGSEIQTFINHVSVPIPKNPSGEHWYIASPFSSNDPNETENWLEEITEIVGELILRYPEVAIFSPISYTSRFALNGTKPQHGWLTICLNHIKRKDRLVIIGQKDWQFSTGIALEVGFAMSEGMSISFLELREAMPGIPFPE